METAVLRALVTRRPIIRPTWETLLRLDRPTSPLAHPDTLVHLLDRSLDEIFRDLGQQTPRAHQRSSRPHCPCGLNPWLAYLAAGRQALCEALIEVQAAIPGLTQADRDDALACLELVLNRLAHREIEAFCALCQSRPVVHAHPASANR